MGWALEQIAEAGFTPITVPAIAREQAFLNQGQFPGHRKRPTSCPTTMLWLAGTAEVALTSLHSGEIIEARQAADPLRRLLALLPPRGGQRGQGRARAAARPPVRQGRAICDLRGRRGAVGRVARASCSQLAEMLLQALEIPYQVIETSTGDMGLGKYRMNDIESWVPSLGQISRDPQLLDPARLAGAARQPPLPRQRTARCASPTRSTTPRWRARGSSCRCSRTTRPRTAACGCPKALQELMGARRILCKYAFEGDDRPPPGSQAAARARLELSRGCGAASARRGPRARGRAAGAGHPRLPRQRPDDDGVAPGARPRPAGGSTAGSWAGTSGVKADTLERLEASGSTRSSPDEPVLVVGWSLGGLFARELARAMPDRVRRWSRSARPSPATCTRTMSGGSTNGSPGTRSTSRRSRASPTSRRCRTSPSGRARTGSSRRAPPAASTDERDEAVELDCSHMAFGVSRRAADQVVRKSTAS